MVYSLLKYIFSTLAGIELSKEGLTCISLILVFFKFLVTDVVVVEEV